ncbi:MAG: hypothetical protein Q8Q02_00300 [Nocardioides sp.]|nr:hypothetical protein [Nocardioides sp.]
MTSTDLVGAHGVGGAGDLPIPAEYAIAGGSAALTLSFVVLLFAWRRARFDPAHDGRPVPGVQRMVESAPFTWTLRVVGLVFTAYVVVAAVFGEDLRINPVFGVVYVWLWVGLVPLSLAFGPVVKALSPVRTIHLLLSRFTGGDPSRGLLPFPERWGYLPAALGLFAFVWLELVYPGGTYLGPVRMWFALYAAVLLVGGAVYGDKWFARADPFEVYSTLVGHLSVWGRRADGALVVRNPMVNLRTIPVAPWLVAVIAVLLGSTAFDSFREAPLWLRYIQRTDLPSTALNTAVMLGFIVAVGVVFWAATAAFRPVEGHTRLEVPGLLAHSVVPIIIGYMVAHYLTLLVEFGQQTLIYLSDPLVRGDDLLGTGSWEVSYVFSSNPTTLATIKVLAIVTGHVLGVVAAHDRSLTLLRKRDQVVGQLPLLFVMVAFTFSGLWLLFGI